VKASPVRVLFVNENVGGHRALHFHLRSTLEEHPAVHPTFFDVPAPGPCRRVATLPVPLLARVDGDLQPLRWQLAQSLVAHRHLARFARRHDVLHAYSQNAVLLSASLLARFPTVVSTDTTNLVNGYQLPYRDPGPLTPATVRLTAVFERRVYAAATLVVAQSGWTAGQLDSYGVPPERVRIIPFGITVPTVDRRRGAGLPRITFVGTTMGRKGGWQLLRVFGEVLRGACRLTLVTRDSVPPEPGVEVVSDLSPGDSRLHRLLEETEVFVLPTEIDKAPYSILEAMAAAVPVVATRVGAIPEMVLEGVTGLLVDPGDDRALAHAITWLLNDPAARRDMGAAGRRRLLERFDARVTTAQLVDVLEEARRRHAATPPNPR